MKGVVVSGGRDISVELLEKYSENAYIVCCDGGIKNFYNSKILPDIVVGDFDSIDEKGKKFIVEKNLKTTVYNPIKNFTDTEAGLEILLDMGMDEIYLLAATGTRMDHTLANIFLLQKIYRRARACMVDNNNIITYVEDGEYSFKMDGHKYISVVAISDEIIYSTEGMKYEVSNLKVLTSQIRGVSNELLRDGKIIVHSGRGFIIRSND